MGSEEVSFTAYLAMLLEKVEELLRKGVNTVSSCMIMAVAESLGWLVLGTVISSALPVIAALFFILAILRGSYWLWRAEKMRNG